ALGVMLDTTRPLQTVTDAGLFGGVTVVQAEARNLTTPASPPRRVRLIPYYLWANRGAAEMSVWLPTREYAPGDVGPAGGFIIYVNPNHATDRWRYSEAAPFDQSAG